MPNASAVGVKIIILKISWCYHYIGKGKFLRGVTCRNPSYIIRLMSEWNVEDALRSLEIEKSVHSDEDSKDIADRIYDENVVASALAISHLAIHSPNEKIRMDAAKYVTERVMGRIGDEKATGEDNPLEKLLADILEQQ